MSDDSDEPEVIVELTGEGLNLPPCRYNRTVISTSGSFKFSARRLRVRIRNEGGDDCLINDLAIGPGSDPAYGLVDGPQTGVRHTRG